MTPFPITPSESLLTGMCFEGYVQFNRNDSWNDSSLLTFDEAIGQI
jgi:hypothetical protein